MQQQDITLKGCKVYDASGTLLATFADESRAYQYKGLIEEARKPSERDQYWQDVRDMAASIESELADQIADGMRGEDLREWLIEHIDESIDSSQRVICTYQAQMCLAFSDNDSAYFDEFGADGAVSDGCINWSALAYSAFRADVIDCLGDVVNDPNPECEECSDKSDDVTKRDDGRMLCDSCSTDDDEDDTEEVSA